MAVDPFKCAKRVGLNRSSHCVNVVTQGTAYNSDARRLPQIHFRRPSGHSEFDRVARVRPPESSRGWRRYRPPYHVRRAHSNSAPHRAGKLLGKRAADELIDGNTLVARQALGVLVNGVGKSNAQCAHGGVDGIKARSCGGVMTRTPNEDAPSKSEVLNVTR